VASKKKILVQSSLLQMGRSPNLCPKDLPAFVILTKAPETISFTGDFSLNKSPSKWDPFLVSP
jgi:hypothetical protein